MLSFQFSAGKEKKQEPGCHRACAGTQLLKAIPLNVKGRGGARAFFAPGSPLAGV